MHSAQEPDSAAAEGEHTCLEALVDDLEDCFSRLAAAQHEAAAGESPAIPGHELPSAAAEAPSGATEAPSGATEAPASAATEALASAAEPAAASAAPGAVGAAPGAAEPAAAGAATAANYVSDVAPTGYYAAVKRKPDARASLAELCGASPDEGAPLTLSAEAGLLSAKDPDAAPSPEATAEVLSARERTGPPRLSMPAVAVIALVAAAVGAWLVPGPSSEPVPAESTAWPSPTAANSPAPGAGLGPGHQPGRVATPAPPQSTWSATAALAQPEPPLSASAHPADARDSLQADAAPDRLAAGTIRVRFERKDGTIIVPVTLRGPAGAVSTRLILDTGATFCMLSRSLLKKLGATPAATASRIKTVAGSVRTSFAVIESIAIRRSGAPGQAVVSGGLLVNTVPETSGPRDALPGLLGLNFTRHFAVTIDHERRELLLRRRQMTPEKRNVFDIRPLVQLLSPKLVTDRGRRAIRFSLRNRSGRVLRDLRLVAMNPTRTSRPVASLRVASVGAGETVALSMGPVPERAGSALRLKLAGGSWFAPRRH